MHAHNHAFSDAARFKYLSRLLIQKGYRSFPTRRQIEEITRPEPALRAWIYGKEQSRFLRDAKFFFKREMRRRRLSPSNDT